MNDKRQTTDTDEELIDILTAISVVSKRLARNLTILITHLKFMGKDEFNTCHWLPQNKTIFICPWADAAIDEIIFTIRSLIKLGMCVAYVISSINADVTQQYSRYLHD